MKRALLLAGMAGATIAAAAWAAIASWMLLATGLGPLPIWEPSIEPSIGIHRLHLSVLDWMVGAYLPLILLGAFWLWRLARSSK